MSVPPSGRKYGDGTPVPFPSYRCKSFDIESRSHAPHSSYTHRCKLPADHVGDHRCICGRSWEPRVPVVVKGPEGPAS